MLELIDDELQLERIRLKLLSHLTTIDATVLGLLAALCDRPLQDQYILLATVLGVLTLFLALVGGIVYMCQYLSQRTAIHNNRYQELTRENPDYEEKPEDIPAFGMLGALFCPIGSVLGLFFLLLSLLLYLCS